MLYLVGLVVFTFASVLCGFAVSTVMLQLSRAWQGVGGAIMCAVSLALLADSFRGKDRGVAFGVWGAVTGLAAAIGPLLGGVLTSGISWRWIFFVNVPIGIAAVTVALPKVDESRAAQASRPDWVGLALFTVALSSLVYGLIESNQRSFTDGLVLGCLAAAAVPGVSRSGPQIATAVQSGGIRNVIVRLPEQARLGRRNDHPAVFTTGLHRILLVAAVIALVSGVVSLAAIRGRDFAQQKRPGSPG
jgi:MFS family permease